jgi:hypothetical protein
LVCDTQEALTGYRARVCADPRELVCGGSPFNIFLEIQAQKDARKDFSDFEANDVVPLKGATPTVARDHKPARGTARTGDGLEARVIGNTALILIHALPDPDQF